MRQYSKEFIEKTIEVWQPYSPEPLTEEDAREIAGNMAELFCLLDELDQKYGNEEKKLQH